MVFERLDELAQPQRDNRVRNLLLLQGDGGTGKTYTLNVLIEVCHARGIPIRATASTGIAATRLLGGCTAHSLFGIPVEEDVEVTTETRFSTVTADSFKGRLLQRTRIFIIDEVGMLHNDDIFAINHLLKFLHDTTVSVAC